MYSINNLAVAFALCLALTDQTAHAQVSIGGTPEFGSYKFRVKQLGEFRERFNMKETTIERSDSLWRQKNLAMLFDCNFYLQHRKLADTFIATVLRDSVRLRPDQRDWWAEAECNVFCDGKKAKLTLILKTESLEGGAYKWVIADAKGKVLELTPDKANPGLKIPALDNEINFMSLSHITSTEARNIKNYTDVEHNIDYFSVFMALVHQKILKIESVQHLTYHFENVAGYSFVVSHFERDSINSGWLISELTK